MTYSAPHYCRPLADCGHPWTVNADGKVGLGTGYAGHPDTGATSCYPCADDWARADMAEAGTFFAYVASERLNGAPYGPRQGLMGYPVTTWSGGELGRVTGSSVATTRYTPSGGRWTCYYVDVRASDGSLWYGTAQGPGMYVRLRRRKVSAIAA